MTASKYYAEQKNELRNKRTGVTGGYAGEILFNKSTTVPEAPRVGCAMDGMATDVYYLKGGYVRDD